MKVKALIPYEMARALLNDLTDKLLEVHRRYYNLVVMTGELIKELPTQEARERWALKFAKLTTADLQETDSE